MTLVKFPVPSLRLKHFSKFFQNQKRNFECPARQRKINVTLTGGNSRVAEIVGLMLKQCPLIKELRIFDFSKGTCGIAMDLDHIDTNSLVKSYTGFNMLPEAILGTDVIVLCGGDATKADQDEKELFELNSNYVRTIALHAAEFNPHAILCIGTPPVSAMVPLASEEYKKAKCYDTRTIIGVTTLGELRANTILSEYTKEEPQNVRCPCLGAMGYKTLVPIISQTKLGKGLSEAVQEAVRTKTATIEREVLGNKNRENSGPCIVSSGYAIARLVTSVVKGLLDIFKGYESAFVRQTGHIGTFLPYMSTVIKLGRYGVDSIHMPHLSNFESVHLQRISLNLKEQIEWGECYVTGGNPSYSVRCKEIRRDPCELINAHFGGGIPLKLNDPHIMKYGKLVPTSK